MAPGVQERGPPTADTLDSGLGLSGPQQPPAWENPGLLPGAAALPGRAGEGIPGICPETAVASLGRIGPYKGSVSAASAGKAPARASRQGCACALRVSPEAGPGPRPGLSSPRDQDTRGLDTWTGAVKYLGRAGEGTQIPGRATNSSGEWAAQHSPPSARPASKKRQQKLIKNHFFFT